MSLATRNRFFHPVGNVIEVESGLWRIFTYGNRPNVDVRGTRNTAKDAADELLEKIEEEGES